ncbi:MAG: 3-deoxy-8-phosphooctulonate synthase [Syntrophobacteraceae bacterium]|jgi:2-dehydro-3-deoxyphosphooctonate aldolase (KDO 8-P synthase)|nr:3-deoxy-8-phosphooctulonate synthase [Syntrophobacteraceae bacterium]MCU0588766.1 3-deoxy-8-phosphooctulonate synthase [Syntrophobacteraceae bacterium]
MTDIDLAGQRISRDCFFVIAGPCVIEGEESALGAARFMAEACGALGIPYVFKSSYDKANRTSIESFRGPGIERGLEILGRVRREIGVPVLTDVHGALEAARAAEVVDILQIPAFLARQTDLLLAAGRTGKPVNIKKGQFLAPWDMAQVISKVRQTGNDQILLTERGTFFGYNNLVVDMRSLSIMGEWGFPVVFDATHSVQLPGGRGAASGGQRQFVAPLARAAVAAGAHGVFLEVHEDPDHALCDGPNSLRLSDVPPLLAMLAAIYRQVRSGPRDGMP